MNLYEKKGKKYVRDATSLDGERIMNDPRFKRTRENMAEFGGSGKVSKSVRLGLVSVIKMYGDGAVGARLTGLFRRMVSLAPGIRGERPVLPQNYGVLLKGMPLNKEYPLQMALRMTPNVQVNPARNGATLTLDQFDALIHLGIPAGATHFRVVLVVCSVSAHHYDPDARKYLPQSASLNALNKLEASPYLAVRGLPVQTLTLNADLPGLPTLGATESLMVMVGVEFHQVVDNLYYPLESGNAMDLVEVY